MRSTPIAIAAGLLQAASASPVELAQRQVTNTPCHDVHFIVARGSYEGYDVGSNRQDNLLVPGVCNGRASCGYEDVVYPAITGDAYCAGSENVGVAAALSQLNDYVGRCPDSKVILTGYSQGAQVVGDMLGGGGGSSCATPNGPMDPNSSPGNKSKYANTFYRNPAHMFKLPPQFCSPTPADLPTRRTTTAMQAVAPSV